MGSFTYLEKQSFPSLRVAVLCVCFFGWLFLWFLLLFIYFINRDVVLVLIFICHSFTYNTKIADEIK